MAAANGHDRTAANGHGRATGQPDKRALIADDH
jgi:hypothetical protein